MKLGENVSNQSWFTFMVLPQSTYMISIGEPGHLMGGSDSLPS